MRPDVYRSTFIEICQDKWGVPSVGDWVHYYFACVNRLPEFVMTLVILSVRVSFLDCSTISSPPSRAKRIRQGLTLPRAVFGAVLLGVGFQPGGHLQAFQDHPVDPAQLAGLLRVCYQSCSWQISHLSNRILLRFVTLSYRLVA